jgi:hypothetical protein
MDDGPVGVASPVVGAVPEGVNGAVVWATRLDPHGDTVGTTGSVFRGTYGVGSGGEVGTMRFTRIQGPSASWSTDRAT